MHALAHGELVPGAATLEGRWFQREMTSAPTAVQGTVVPKAQKGRDQGYGALDTGHPKNSVLSLPDTRTASEKVGFSPAQSVPALSWRHLLEEGAESGPGHEAMSGDSETPGGAAASERLPVGASWWVGRRDTSLSLSPCVPPCTSPFGRVLPRRSPWGCARLWESSCEGRRPCSPGLEGELPCGLGVPCLSPRALPVDPQLAPDPSGGKWAVLTLRGCLFAPMAFAQRPRAVGLGLSPRCPSTRGFTGGSTDAPRLQLGPAAPGLEQAARVRTVASGLGQPAQEQLQPQSTDGPLSPGLASCTTGQLVASVGDTGAQALPAGALAPHPQTTWHHLGAQDPRALRVPCCIGAPAAATPVLENSGRWPRSRSDHVSNPGSGLSGGSPQPQSPVASKARSPSRAPT